MFTGRGRSFCFANAQALKAAVLPQDTVRPAENAMFMLLRVCLPRTPPGYIGDVLSCASVPSHLPWYALGLHGLCR